MLTDQIMTSDSRCKGVHFFKVIIVVGGRVPKIDKVTEDILSEEAMIVYLNYVDQLKSLFT